MSEAVLILESDRSFEAQLNEVLSAAGLEVYAADTVAALLRALKATAFPLVVVDAGARDVAIAPVLAQIGDLQPDTAVIVTGRGCSTNDAIEMMRAGCFDFVPKPFDPAGLTRAAHGALERRRRTRSRIRGLEKRVRAAESAARDAVAGSGLNETRLVRASEFADFALERILALERRIADLSGTHGQTGGPSARPEVPTWVVHSDPEFAAGVAALGPRLHLDVSSPMSTGGEVLDRISGEPPGIIVLDAALPDIPISLLTATIGSEHPDVQLLVIDGWGTEARSLQWAAGSTTGPVTAMHTVQDLIDALDASAERAAEGVRGRAFAAEFRARNDDLLRRIAELKRVLT